MDTLPNDILHYLCLSYLNILDIVHLSRVNKVLYAKITYPTRFRDYLRNIQDLNLFGKALEYYSRIGSMDYVTCLVKCPQHDSLSWPYPGLREACQAGNLEIAEYLLNVKDYRDVRDDEIMYSLRGCIGDAFLRPNNHKVINFLLDSPVAGRYLDYNAMYCALQTSLDYVRDLFEDVGMEIPEYIAMFEDNEFRPPGEQEKIIEYVLSLPSDKILQKRLFFGRMREEENVKRKILVAMEPYMSRLIKHGLIVE